MKLLWIVFISTILFTQDIYTQKDIKVIHDVVPSKAAGEPINDIQKWYHKSGDISIETP